MPRILLVDDEEKIINILEGFFTKMGFEIIKAVGGKKAEEIVGRDSRFDLAILDLKMPNINGIQVLKQMHKHNKNIPVIILTGSIDTTKHIDELKDAGCSEKDILFKPADLFILLEKVKEKLRI